MAEKENHPELLDSLSPFPQPLPQEANDAEQKRDAIKHIVSLVLPQFIG